MIREQMVKHYAEVRARLYGRQKPTSKPVLVFVNPKPEVPHAELVGPWSGPRASKSIIQAVCIKHGVLYADFMGMSRTKKLSNARAEAYYRLREELGMSFPQIAERVGRSDHTSAMHGYYKHKKGLGL